MPRCGDKKGAHSGGCNCGSSANLVGNAVLNGDPTRTLTLRRAFIAQMNKRFRLLKGQINAAVIRDDVFKLKTPNLRTVPLIQAHPVTEPFPFNTTTGKVDSFMAWLKTREREGILELVSPPSGFNLATGQQNVPWTNQFIQSSYQQGISRGRAELRAQGFNIPESIDDALGTRPIDILFNQPQHLDRAAALFTRTFNDLTGITNAMDTQISRVLTQGLLEGRSPEWIAREINRTVDGLGLNRARTLARTEIIRAHHLANIQEYRNAGALGVEVRAEWATAGDFRVCQRCKDMSRTKDGTPIIYTLDEIEGLIPLHPNCRCFAIPIVAEDITGTQRGRSGRLLRNSRGVMKLLRTKEQKKEEKAA